MRAQELGYLGAEVGVCLWVMLPWKCRGLGGRSILNCLGCVAGSSAVSARSLTCFAWGTSVLHKRLGDACIAAWLLACRLRGTW